VQDGFWSWKIVDVSFVKKNCKLTVCLGVVYPEGIEVKVGG